MTIKTVLQEVPGATGSRIIQVEQGTHYTDLVLGATGTEKCEVKHVDDRTEQQEQIDRIIKTDALTETDKYDILKAMFFK